MRLPGQARGVRPGFQGACSTPLGSDQVRLLRPILISSGTAIPCTYELNTLQAGNIAFHTFREAVLPELRPCRQCQKRCRHVCQVSAALGEALSLQHPVLTKCVRGPTPDVAVAWRARGGADVTGWLLYSDALSLQKHYVSSLDEDGRP